MTRAILTHNLDLRSYPVESHADLLVAFHSEYQLREIRDGHRLIVIISKAQERSLIIEATEQLAAIQEFDFLPLHEIKGCCGWPVEIRE